MEMPQDGSVDQLQQLRAAIARHQAACGCELGSVFALATLVAFLVYVKAGEPQWTWWGTVLRGVGWVGVVSVAGKLVGLAYARVRIRRLQAELRLLASSQQHPVRRG